MEDLIKKLESIPGSYFNFVVGIVAYVKQKPERLDVVIDYINNTENVTPSDVVYFVSTQPDFFETRIMEEQLS